LTLCDILSFNQMMPIRFITFEPKIAVQSVRSLINYCERSGLLRANLLKVTRLTESQLNDSRLLVGVPQYEELYRYASHALSDTILGFKYGQAFEPDRWGVLGYIALTSQSIATAMAAQYRFQSLSGNMGAPLQINHGMTTTLQWVPAYNCSHHLTEQIITGLVSLSRTLTNDNNYAPCSVFFTHKCKSDKHVYEDYFQCPVNFDSEYNGIVLDNSALEANLTKSDAELNKVLYQHAQTMLADQTSSSPLEVIKDYVIKTLPSHVPDIEEVSRYLNLSVRSTQRKLHEYGTSFSQVLDAIRKELALTYLRQTDNPVLYVSERLGFSEQSAFQRAFKRWTGTTPRHYRLSILSE
jgi:AraC-like DNA-binding protein